MDKEQKNIITQTIKECLRNKFQNYEPETTSMPFHFRLLGKDRMALYSFIHSINTNFGTAIFEPVAQKLALPRFSTVETQQKAKTIIYSDAQHEIQRIIDSLETASSKPAKLEEIERIRKLCQSGEPINVKLTKIDLKLISHDGKMFFTDIKSPKPNSGEFRGFKRTLLDWIASELAVNPNANIETFLSMPYNPYEPAKYKRWTMRGMIDLEYELKVADEFWDFLGGEGTYAELLDCFEKAGIELREEIDKYFEKFRNIL